MFKKGLIVIGVVGIVGLIIGWKHVSAFLIGQSSTANSKTIEIPIAEKKSMEELAETLLKGGIISNKDKFLSLADYKHVTIERIEPGMYAIPKGTSLRTLLNALVSGSLEVEVTVTFNNCKTLGDLAEKISECLMINPGELEEYITNQETLNQYGFTLETIPAMFLPNSYRMYYDTDKEDFVKRMAKEFKNFWTLDRMAALKAVGLESPSDAVTLASIVYGEQSKNTSEWPIIAGLYLNRLRTGMKLQSDPTFKFCWDDQLEGVQRLLNEHREKDCPYNTYIYEGLPPGPISMPPTELVDAVLHPDNNDYLYMCAKPSYDGLHDFTAEYSVHDKNAKIFQSWLANELKNQ